MKIAHIGSRGIPASYSGVEKAIEKVSLRLAGGDLEAIVYCHSKKFRVSEYRGIKLVGLPTINTKHLATLTHTILSTLHVIFTNTHIVHYHCLAPSIFSFIPRLFGKKTIVTVHALDWKRTKWNHFVRFLLKLCEISAIYFPCKTIVVSKYLKNYFKNKYGKRTHLIPNGVDIDKAPATTLGNYILYVGRLVPEKGLHWLIQAFNDIKTDKELWIAGISAHSDNYVKALKKAAGARVKFLGSVYAKALDELYKNSYLFVLPSEVEGWSVVLLEAMSYGKCCVISDIPEYQDEFSDCTITFKNRDHIELKKKLELLLNNPGLVKEVGKKAREKIVKDYSWDKIFPLFKEAYS